MHYTGSVDPGWLALIAAMIVGGALKGIHTGWYARETEAKSRKIATQRRRYGFVIAGQVLIVAAFAGMYFFGPVADYVAVLKEFTNFSDLGYYAVVGWATTILLAAGLVSPLFTLAAAVHIYRHPSAMAYKKFRGGYVPTQHHRNGGSLTTNYVILIDPATRQVQRSWI